MASTGLWMLLALGALVLGTGLPVWALLVGVSSAFAAFGVAAGVVDTGILAAVGLRLVNLLEHDLLQALPLYVFIGVLMQRLPIADALFDGASRLFRATPAAPSLAALAVGTLVAPMNGSVASSSALLSRLVAPRLRTSDPARAISLVSAAATIGVVVPPSLVLILLGDAMLRAHTEASNLPGYGQAGQRIVNTQDVLHAALVPALCVLFLWGLCAWLQGRKAVPTVQTTPHATAAPTRNRDALAAVVTLIIVTLLCAVFAGWLYAVEAAAAGGCLLMAATLAKRALNRAQWSEVLGDTLSLSGALFALLVGATTFSLVFRLFGTDRWIAALVLSSAWPPVATAALVLLLVAACAWVLDAFEMIFVIIPIVAPLLIVQLGDAQQVAVLLLLVLQLSFLVPPMGYAVLMARSQSGLGRVSNAALLRALAPFIAAQVAIAGLVFAAPSMVHRLDAAKTAREAAAPPSDADIVKQMEEMAPQGAEAADPAEPASAARKP